MRRQRPRGASPFVLRQVSGDPGLQRSQPSLLASALPISACPPRSARAAYVMKEDAK